jgi:hypothetical protein
MFTIVRLTLGVPEIGGTRLWKRDLRSSGYDHFRASARNEYHHLCGDSGRKRVQKQAGRWPVKAVYNQFFKEGK